MGQALLLYSTRFRIAPRFMRKNRFANVNDREFSLWVARVKPGAGQRDFEYGIVRS